MQKAPTRPHRRLNQPHQTNLLVSPVERNIKRPSTPVQTGSPIQLLLRLPPNGRRGSNIADRQRAAQLVTDLCQNGDCAVPQSEFLRRASDSKIVEPRRALALAIQEGVIYRESIEDQVVLFPSGLRDAELTIVRCARHLAEGSKEKFKLVHSENHGATMDFLLPLVRTSCERMSFLAGDLESAKWWAMKIEEPVIALRSWLHADSDSPSNIKGVWWHRAAYASRIALLDAGRHSIESLAATLEAIPQETFVTLIGSLDETPINGHGQPFHDLVESKAFPVTAIRQKGCWGNPVARIRPARRRSALIFRLQRACGIESAHS